TRLRGFLSSSYFGSEILLATLDALANHKNSISINSGVVIFEHLLNTLFIIFNKGLAQQSCFLDILVHRASNNLLDDMLGTTKLFCFFFGQACLTLEHFVV